MNGGPIQPGPINQPPPANPPAPRAANPATGRIPFTSSADRPFTVAVPRDLDTSKPLTPPLPPRKPDLLDFPANSYRATIGTAVDYVADLARGFKDTPPPGKPGSIVGEELLKAALGEAAKVPFKVIGNSPVGSTDPSGQAEPPALVTILTPKDVGLDFRRFTDAALLKVLGMIQARQLLTPQAIVTANAAAQELADRQGAAAAARLTASLIAPRRVFPVVAGGANDRAQQAVDALNEADAIGQVLGTIVFPGWKADP